MIVHLINTLPAVLGVLMIAAAVWEYMLWMRRFGAWRAGAAVSQGAVKRVGDVGPRLAYEFTVDGVAHSGLSSRMRDALPEKGRKVRIFYNPANPDESDWYDTGMHMIFVYGVAVIGALMLWAWLLK